MKPFNNEVWDQAWDQAWNQFWNQVDDQVSVQVRDQVWDPASIRVYDQVRNQYLQDANNPGKMPIPGRQRTQTPRNSCP